MTDGFVTAVSGGLFDGRRGRVSVYDVCAWTQQTKSAIVMGVLVRRIDDCWSGSHGVELMAGRIVTGVKGA